ncbi:MAG: hypothetical protein CMO06_16710 [Thalassospira sp.]|nr:hypothetical protein [Thalassospira sp.]
MGITNPILSDPKDLGLFDDANATFSPFAIDLGGICCILIEQSINKNAVFCGATFSGKVPWLRGFTAVFMIIPVYVTGFRGPDHMVLDECSRCQMRIASHASGLRNRKSDGGVIATISNR